MRVLMFLLLLSTAITSQCQQALPLREQAVTTDEILGERLNHLLPALMERHGLDMWIVMSREYNEDPVLKTMLPATWLSARRRTILVFYRNPTTKQFEKLAIARYNVGEHIKAAWDLQRFPNQWQQLVQLISERNPRNIAINTSAHFGHADGMVWTEYNELMTYLPAGLRNRVVSAEKLAVAWLETRTEREMQLYPQLINATHAIIREGFSEQVVVPGVTTTDDVVWWFRQKIRSLGYDTWFHPSVAVQRSDSLSFEHLRSFSNRPRNEVIQPGDLLHVDIGISYLRLHTDIQQHAYVLRPGETEVPKGIQKAMEKANRLQDLLTARFTTGQTGNQILAAALADAKANNIEAVIYTHPLGLHGHAAGPTIGLWDQQGGVPGSGDYPLYEQTAYSIELNAASFIPEWNKSIRIMLEEDGYYDARGFRYISGRQKTIHLIPKPQPAISIH